LNEYKCIPIRGNTVVTLVAACRESHMLVFFLLLYFALFLVFNENNEFINQCNTWSYQKTMLNSYQKSSSSFTPWMGKSKT